MKIKNVSALAMTFILLLAAIGTFPCEVYAAADEKPVWLSDFVVTDDVIYSFRTFYEQESYVSGKTLCTEPPEVLRGKGSDMLFLSSFCFYGDKIYYSLRWDGVGAGACGYLYSCDLNGENDTLIADDLSGGAVIYNNVIYYQAYEDYCDEEHGYEWGWWKDVIYKLNLSDLSSKQKLAEADGAFDFYETENWLDFYDFDGEWLFYETGYGYYKVDTNGNHITEVSGDLDEFTLYQQARVYGDKTYYVNGNTIYKKDRNGGNAVSLCSVSLEDTESILILYATDENAYYEIFNYTKQRGEIYEVKSPVINVLLDGTALTFDQPPVIIGDRTMVPLRVIFEEMDYSVEWNQETQTATAKKFKNSITVQIGNNVINYTLNGKSGTYTCDVEPQIVNGRTLVPLRAIAECAGCNVDWNSAEQTATITTDQQKQWKVEFY